MHELINDDIELCLDYYDPEKRIFPRIAVKISAKKELTKDEVLQILMWKIRHVKVSNAATISDDNMAIINFAIGNADNENGAPAALELLNRVPGLGLVAGTALLSVCHPEDFVILDVRILELLNFFPSRKKEGQERAPGLTYWSVNDYLVDYLPRVKRQRDWWGCTLQDAHRALCGLRTKRLISAIEHRSIAMSSE